MIIGLSGYARAGKSEAAKALAELGWKPIAFADKLRKFLYTLNPMVMPGIQPAFGIYYRASNLRDIIDTYGWEGYKNTPYNNEIRRLIQTIGTDCGRNILGENVWVDATLKEIDPSRNWVVQDVRFPNEAQVIKAYGGKIIRINRESVGPVNAHFSEVALDDFKFDAVITNTTLEKLHRKAKAFDVWGD